MYTKLYSTILDSSIWSASNSTRLVWITMLAMATKNGIVHASVDGLARRANVSLEETEQALELLSSPDPHDKSGVNGGRRIIPMQGCWELINFEFYREAKSIDAVRKQQWRTKKSDVLDKGPSSSSSSSSDQRELLSSPAPPAPDERQHVQRVFDAWRSVHRHPNARLDSKRLKRIRQALVLFTPDQLECAVRGAAKDDWLMGRDPKSPRKYDGLETILRDTAQIERLIELAAVPVKARPGETTEAEAMRKFRGGK
jgi:hypothetical protein